MRMQERVYMSHGVSAGSDARFLFHPGFRLCV